MNIANIIKNPKDKLKNPKIKRPKKAKILTPANLLKMEIADELGLMPKVRLVGWGGLSAAETGRIGGIMTRKLRQRPLNNDPNVGS